MIRYCVAAIVTTLLFAAPAHAEPAKADDTCMYFNVNNIVNSADGNWYIYLQFSKQPYTFRKGDRLEYDIFLAADNPSAKGGIDADFADANLPEPLRALP